MDCPKCGQWNPVGAVYCACGHDLTGSGDGAGLETRTTDRPRRVRRPRGDRPTVPALVVGAVVGVVVGGLIVQRGLQHASPLALVVGMAIPGLLGALAGMVVLLLRDIVTSVQDGADEREGGGMPIGWDELRQALGREPRPADELYIDRLGGYVVIGGAEVRAAQSLGQGRIVFRAIPAGDYDDGASCFRLVRPTHEPADTDLSLRS